MQTAPLHKDKLLNEGSNSQPNDDNNQPIRGDVGKHIVEIRGKMAAKVQVCEDSCCDGKFDYRCRCWNLCSIVVVDRQVGTFWMLFVFVSAMYLFVSDGKQETHSWVQIQHPF